MKDGVPPHMIDEHIKNFKQAVKDGKTTDPSFGLEKTAIAGAGKLAIESVTLVRRLVTHCICTVCRK